MIKRLIFAAPVAMVLVVFSIAAAFAADDLPTLRVGHVGHDHQIALYVAAEAGKSLEARHGAYLVEVKPQEVYDLYDGGRAVARVQMVLVGGGSKMPAALEQGAIEVGLGGLAPVAKFYDKGTDLKVLAPLNNDGDALLMRAGHPAGSWREFVEYAKASKSPVKIGYKDPMAVAFMILTRGLDEEGVTYGPEVMGPSGKPNMVVLVNLQGQENTLPALESGIIEGVVANEPLPSILVHKGVAKRVADLSDLPPDGKWDGHPCCVVAARADALKEKRAIIVALLKVIAAGGELIAQDKELALAAEGKWTRTAPEVGAESIANVDYVVVPDKEWLEGVDTWMELMKTSGHLKGRLKDGEAGGLVDLTPMGEALGVK